MTYVGNTPLSAWECFSDKGKPVCVASLDDVGLSVTIYYSKKKGIKGVAVYDDTGALVDTVGKVPKAALES